MQAQKISVWRLLAKATILFIAFNLLFSTFSLQPFLGRLTFYNWLLPGRERLPYGDDPERSYNLNLYSLEAMFASHVVSAPKAPDEYRVFVIGDSSVWGFLLQNDDTLTGALNATGLHAADGRRVVFYNLGHPTISLTKDLLILDYAMQYQPDLIIWPVTLEAFPLDKQLSSPIVQNNADRVSRLITSYQLPVAVPATPSFFDRTIIGQRRNLADIARLQLYGVIWAATSVDVHIPDEIELRAVDLEPSEDFAGLQPPVLHAEDLAFDVIEAGLQMTGDVPVLIVNEPIFVSDGLNSDIRYNSFYPRWAYDSYRELLQTNASQLGWTYLDAWGAADDAEFTNTPIHLTPQGTLQFADAILETLQTVFSLQP